MSTTLHVGPAAPGWSTHALFLSGQHPVPQPVTLQFDHLAEKLVIQGEGIDLRWHLRDIREIKDQAGSDQMVLRHCNEMLPRVIVSGRELAPHLPKRKANAPVTKRGPLLAWAVAAVASVALIILVLVPTMADQMAGFLPIKGQRALGDATFEQVRRAMDQNRATPINRCDAPEGVDALRTLEAKLEAAMPEPVDLSVHVLDHPMVNAFALPGGYVVFFRGLIDKATAPEQVAAVFAHEIGHVVSRDPTRHALRSAGSIGVLGLLFGDFAGGAMVLLLTERLINAQYAQAAEADADVFAFDVLKKAGIAPSALADMFASFRKGDNETDAIIKHFQSHPELGDRMAKARAATPEDFESIPVLSDEEWQALKNICK